MFCCDCGYGGRWAWCTTVSPTRWVPFPFAPMPALLVWCSPACAWSVNGHVVAAAAVLLVNGCLSRLMVGLFGVGSLALQQALARSDGVDQKLAMHGLENQCSCSVPPHQRSCPGRALPFLSFTSQQTPHGFPGRGCGASPSGILKRGIVCVTIGPLYGRECARSGWHDGRYLVVAACPCVWVVAGLCILVVDEEVIIPTAVSGCLLCFLCVYLDAVL